MVGVGIVLRQGKGQLRARKSIICSGIRILLLVGGVGESRVGFPGDIMAILFWNCYWFCYRVTLESRLPFPAPAHILRLKITLAGAQFVEELTGFSVGTIPPLGHRIRLPTLVDAELLDYSMVIGGGGRR